jgi:hypothetical protein
MINWLKDELAKRNPHKLLAQRKRQFEFLLDKMGRVPQISNITRKLNDIRNDLLLVFCAGNLDKAAAALKVLEEVNTELQGAGYRKLGVEVAKLVSQAQWAYREKWGSLTMKEIFNKMDSDSDDVITESELYAVFHELKMPQFSSEDISGIFRLADPEGSGKLSWEAFKITFDIPDPVNDLPMDPDDQLLLEVEGAIMNILGFLPSDKAAEMALDFSEGMPYRNSRDVGAAAMWMMEHQEDWFYFIGRQPTNQWRQNGTENGNNKPPQGYEWRCFEKECKMMGGTWQKKKDLFCTICKSRRPDGNSNWGN